MTTIETPLTGHQVVSREEWTAARKELLAREKELTRLRDQVQAWARERLAWPQQAGHCCVMVSASPDIYLARVAEQLGFDALVCTEMQVEGDRLTGYMRTPNCYGEQKVLRLRAWLAERFGPVTFAGTTLYAYGDTSGDKPMLRLAQHAWYRGQPWKEESSGV